MHNENNNEVEFISMKLEQYFFDKMAISLSLLCVLHCLALPLLLVLLPSLVALQLDNEAFHLWMVLAVIPTSTYALTMGCKRHKQYRFLAFGVIGLFLLLSALVGEEIIGEVSEKILTVLGAVCIAYGHFRNFRLCQQHEECPCPEH